EDVEVQSNFDMYATSKYNAIKKYFNIWVMDGMLNINLKGVVGSAFLNGLEVALIHEAEATTAYKNANLSDLISALNLSVFPNPVTNNAFIIKSDILSGKYFNVKIYDKYGSIHFEENLKGASDGIVDVNLGAYNFKSGIYFIKITNKEGSVQLAKFIKE
ncbi:MAG TPA: T9SS type A sorting domain-containing protein, partial [Cytophagales bacterium]|nr:T9SS type A sorting domain-containing protein [Cytophagales bacterium]